MSDGPEINEALDHVMRFGKHKGRVLGEIVSSDILYLDWLRGLDNLREPLDTYVRVICEEYASEIETAMAEGEFDR